MGAWNFRFPPKAEMSALIAISELFALVLWAPLDGARTPQFFEALARQPLQARSLRCKCLSQAELDLPLRNRLG